MYLLVHSTMEQLTCERKYIFIINASISSLIKHVRQFIISDNSPDICVGLLCWTGHLYKRIFQYVAWYVHLVNSLGRQEGWSGFYQLPFSVWHLILFSTALRVPQSADFFHLPAPPALNIIYVLLKHPAKFYCFTRMKQGVRTRLTLLALITGQLLATG